ncbi:MAG: hypothetical protein R2788_14500 [Saprospiraceae bacterium]
MQFEPSPHQAAKAYISVLRYQLGDWQPYIFKTTDYGKSMEANLPEGIPADYPVRVVREDPDREGLLYAGTEYGLFVSFDDGNRVATFPTKLAHYTSDRFENTSDLVLSTMVGLLDFESPLGAASGF